MKKFTALLLALVMVLSLAACGAKNDATTDIPDSTTLLSNVFAQYAEDEKFPVGGGSGDFILGNSAFKSGENRTAGDDAPHLGFRLSAGGDASVFIGVNLDGKPVARVDHLKEQRK